MKGDPDFPPVANHDSAPAIELINKSIGILFFLLKI